MSRTIFVGCVGLWSVASLLCAVPLPAVGQQEEQQDWGEVVDPDGDCTVRFGEAGVTIEVPGTPHDLSAELGVVNAPRILHDVEGDFIAEVKVTGIVKPEGDPTVPGRTPYNGAGLLLWLDEETYVRLERAGLTRPSTGELQSYANFEVRKKGGPGGSTGRLVPSAPLHLRLERRGDRVLGSISPDGLSWKAFDALEVELPAKVRVGVAAINSASEPFKAEFKDFAVFGREKLTE
ncbi:MAG: DUF1349 domain-containing protein [Planctomycetaceae bacterium]